MHFQFEMAQQAQPAAAAPGDPAATSVELLRALLEVQHEQLQLTKAAAAAHDAGARWRAVLARWPDDFAGLPGACKHVLPLLERAYVDLVAELTDHLKQSDRGTLDNEFALAEFLDRYGMRLNQLGGLLNVVGPLAEVAATENK